MSDSSLVLRLEEEIARLQIEVFRLEAEQAAHPCGCLACVRERQAALDAVYAIDDRVIGIRRGGTEA